MSESRSTSSLQPPASSRQEHGSPPPPASSRPLLIALTGGIASGKSAVADLFAKLGVPVLDTDQIARDVVEPGSPALAQLVAEFGADVLDASGRLDRVRMRERVFKSPEQRKRLEAITHPAIRAELARRSAHAGGDYQIHVIPLLVEGGRADAYDRVLVVDVPASHQVQRLMARDGASAAEAQRILEAQATREQRLEIADDVIVNTGGLDDLQGFVDTLHRNYSLIAAAREISASRE
jgi:dephospho-CoA kinase